MDIIEPMPRLRPSFLEAWDEFDVSRDGDGDSAGWMGAFRWEREKVETAEGFEAMCSALRAEREVPAPGFVPACMLWAVEGDQWLGRASVRLALNEHLAAVGGHIGYAVRPSARRRGIATALLRASLDELRAAGIDPALVTCGDDNVGSYRTIEKAGGVLEDVLDGTRRYWVPTA